MPSGILNNGVTITWYGHATTMIGTPGGKRVLIDPWVRGNPACPPALHEVPALDAMLITHGHGDHVGDAIAIAATARPQKVIAIHEVATWLDSKGVANVSGMNRGGTQEVAGVRVTMTPAVHSSSISDGDVLVDGGAPAGFVVTLENGFRVYHAGDTDVFGDMALIREMWQPDIAILPIGDHYTMGPAGAARAARLLGVKQVIPIHFGTFPILNGTPAALRAAGAADSLEVLTLRPGETLS